MLLVINEQLTQKTPLRGRVGRAAVWSPYGTRPECGTRGISHPRNARVPEGAPPTIRCAAGVPGGRWDSVVYGWRTPRPPRVVFVLGFASLIHSLTSGKKHLQYTNVVVVVVLSAGGGDFLKKKLGFAIESCKRLNLVSD